MSLQEYLSTSKLSFVLYGSYAKQSFAAENSVVLLNGAFHALLHTVLYFVNICTHTHTHIYMYVYTDELV
jgi:hypothetical protein